MSPMSLPSWPPQTTPEHTEHLTHQLLAYCLAHSLLLLPPGANPASAIHAPVSLFPTPFPRQLYAHALELGPAFNELYAKITLDVKWLDGVMEKVAGVDEFQGELWKLWREVRDDAVQPLHLLLSRSDYLLHTASAAPLSLRQVEYNTMSSSFGALSTQTHGLHAHLLRDPSYAALHPQLRPENLPENETLRGLVDGLAAGHAAYEESRNENEERERVVLFVVQDAERNVFDQRLLEYDLLRRHNIRTIRLTHTELSTRASLSPSRALILTHPTSPHTPPVEVSIVYFRSGYTPEDYPTPSLWRTRSLLERSSAIKCPTLALQLAGAKKVQQVLAAPGVVERFLGPGSKSEAVRSVFAGLWPLDDSPEGREAQALARDPAQAVKYVLKPQREGGGNNIYREAIPPFFEKLSKDQREAYILMELIEPPAPLANALVKGGEGVARTGEVVSELGVYGTALFGVEKGIVRNEVAGHLLRTKGRESDEGGVAVGFSVIDELLLVDV